MPIRRIMTIVRSQYESLQKRFGSNSSKKEETAQVAEEPVAAAEAETGVVVAAEEAPIASEANPTT